jgi:hypothetical protein
LGRGRKRRFIRLKINNRKSSAASQSPEVGKALASKQQQAETAHHAIASQLVSVAGISLSNVLVPSTYG